MAIDGIDRCRHVSNIQYIVIVAESERNERADAGWDSRTCLARPNSQARTGTARYSFSLLS